MSKMVSMVSSAVGWFERFETWLAYIAGFCMVAMAITTFYETVARYIFRSPTAWSMELNVDLMVYFAFLAGAYVLLLNKHVRVDVLFVTLSARQKAVLDIVTFTLALSFIAVLIWQGLGMAMYSLASGTRSGYGMEWPEFPLQIIIPIGSLVLGLQMVIKIARDIKFVFSTHPK